MTFEPLSFRSFLELISFVIIFFVSYEVSALARFYGCLKVWKRMNLNSGRQILPCGNFFSYKFFTAKFVTPASHIWHPSRTTTIFMIVKVTWLHISSETLIADLQSTVNCRKRNRMHELWWPFLLNSVRWIKIIWRLLTAGLFAEYLLIREFDGIKRKERGYKQQFWGFCLWRRLCLHISEASFNIVPFLGTWKPLQFPWVFLASIQLYMYTLR